METSPVTLIGSKDKLNESTVPLLDEEETEKAGETPEKESIELTEKSSDAGSQAEKDDSAAEKTDKDSKEEKPEKKKKEKKEKKVKVHVPRPALPTLSTMTAGLNLLDRDDHLINDHVNITFSDLLAEPDSGHSFDAIWRVIYLVFSGTKFWVYKLLAAVVGLPLAIIWAVLFALITLLNVWLVTPLFKLFALVMQIIRMVWAELVSTFLEPVCHALGACCARRDMMTRSQTAEAVPI